MFVLLLSTVLTATIFHNVGMSQSSVQDTEYRYLSLGAANELISDLNEGLDPDTYTSDSPKKITNDSSLTESWVEPLEQNEKHIFVAARTYRSDPTQAETVRKLAIFREDAMARVYTNSPDSDTDSPDPIYYSDVSDSGAWSRIPDVPRMRYDASGNLEVRPGELAGTIPYISGSPDGSLYALYVPVLDGWGDTPTGVSILKLKLGDFALQLMIKGGREGMTVGDLQPIGQVVIDVAEEVTISKGVVPLKFDHDNGQWSPLPPIPEAKLINDKFVIDEGNYHVQGISGPPASYDGGTAAALYRKGQDAIYQYTEEPNEWNVLTPPGKDVLLMAAEPSGALYVQTGDLRPVGFDYLLNILTLNVLEIFPNTSVSAIHRYDDGEWSPIPDPPARYFNKSGELINQPYLMGRGPSLGGMTSGDDGEFVVVSRPPKLRPDLVDTVYRYRDGQWKVVKSPPNTHYDNTGNEVTRNTLPSRLEAGSGPNGQLVLRVPSKEGSDGIFVESEVEGEYDILPPIRTEDGSFQQYLSQIAVGPFREGTNKGSYIVRATYF